MNKFLWLLYQPYKWLIFFPFLIVNTLIFGFLAVTLSLLINQKVGSFIGGAVWARLNSFFTPIFVNVKGRQHIDKKQSYVIVANHLSAYDIFVLYGWLGIDFKWVMKKELRKIPGLGFGSAAVGHIFIDRSNSAAALKSIDEAKKKITNGTSVVFFPEGTRSRSAKLLPFKKGAFKFALELGLPLLPITINGTNKILPNDSANLMPGKAELIIHPPIDIKNYDEKDMSKLMGEAKEIIQSSRNQKK